MRVVFMGTAEYAVPALTALARDPRFQLVLVVTQPDAKAGRGLRVATSPVHKAVEALELDVAVEQPQNASDPDFVKVLRAAAPDLVLTAAYGQKLSDEVLAIPARGALNLHASLLPRHRGAAPVQHAILAGDRTTGVTLMGMTSRLDAGPLYAQKSIPIEPSDTGGSLMEKLADLARDLLLEQADALVAGTLKGVPQDESQATLAPSLEKEDGRVRWNQTAEEIDRQVRAMTPWPAAYTLCPTDRSPSRLILVSGSVVDIPSPAMPGTVVAFTSGIEVATKKGVYRLIEVKRSGKRALSAVEFLRGFPIPVGTRLQ